LAEQQRDVAKLEKEAATFTKQKDILLGEGEAARKKLVMQADGALTQKLKAWIEVNKSYASAMGSYQGDWVPKTQFNGTGTTKTATNGASTLIDLLTAKTADDLSLKMSITK